MKIFVERTMIVDISLDAVIQKLYKPQGKQTYKADDLCKVFRYKGIYKTPHPKGRAQAAAAYAIKQRHLSPGHMNLVCTISKAGYKGICTESEY